MGRLSLLTSAAAFVFPFLVLLWFSLALWETIIKPTSHYKILCDPMVIFKDLSILKISLFILSNGKWHRYFPFTLQQKVAGLLSALGEAISDCAQFVLLLTLDLITSITIFPHLVSTSRSFLSLTLLKSLVHFRPWASQPFERIFWQT